MGTRDLRKKRSMKKVGTRQRWKGRGGGHRDLIGWCSSSGALRGACFTVFLSFVWGFMLF